MCWARMGCVLLVIVLATSIVEAAPSVPKKAASTSRRVTHKQVQEIKIAGSHGGGLQALTRTTDGRLVALIGRPRNEGIRPDEGNVSTTEICVFDDDGKELRRWNVDFAGQAITGGPEGSVIVAGDGNIGRFDGAGQLLLQADVPHLAAILADKNVLQKQAEEQIETQKKSTEQMKKAYAAQAKFLKTRIEKLEAIDSDAMTAADSRKLKRLQQQLKAYESINLGEREAEVSIDSVMQQLVQRAATISGVTSNDQDVFVVCGEQKGHGFAVWRMDHEFKNPTRVLSQLGGCCGQMDVQASGSNLFVAENTKHRVGHYDRDGKRLQAFGARAGLFSSEGFGGCCNPMNVCFGPNGDIFTAESEGIIRRFSPKGKALGLVGRVTLLGGCKNVAVAASLDGEKIYFCDLPGSRIIVMGPVTDESEAQTLAQDPKPQAAVESESDEGDAEADDDEDDDGGEDDEDD